jgi:Ca2+-binding RTX toxin-like protein
MFSADAAARSANATFEAGISNFEILSLGATGAGAGDAVNVANLDDISTVISAGVTAGGLTLSGLQAINDVTFTGLIAAGSSLALATDTGNADIVNVNLVAADGFTSTADLTINGVETINVMTDDNAGAAATTRFTQGLAADEVTNLNVSGDTGLIIGNMAGTTLTTFDASGMTGTGEIGGVDFAATGALAAESTFTGGAGNDDLRATAAVAVVNMDGGEGNDVLTGGTKADVLVGGEGTDIMTGGAGPDSLTGGAGADVFAFNTASATDSNGVNQDTIEDFVSGTDKISTGSYVSYQGEANGYGAVLTSLSNSSGNIEGVLDTQTNTLYIDVNDDGDLTVADLTINLGTVSDLSQSDFVTHVGTFGDDVINGTANKDVILAFDGADNITGGVGADTLTGGAGTDTFVHTTGDATIFTFTDVGTTGSTAVAPAANDTFAGAEVINDFNAGGDADTLTLGNITTVDGSTMGTLEGNEYMVFAGEYAGDTFTVGDGATDDATNGDSLVIFDGDSVAVGVQQEAIVLVGVDTVGTGAVSATMTGADLTFA